MCHTIGVDSLAASNVKGKGQRGLVSSLTDGGSFWTQILGGDDFYLEVAVIIVELCRKLELNMVG